jgi:hypothetical protein
LAELRSADGAAASDYGQRVVMMNFTAAPEEQWRFIVAAIESASSDSDLGHIAAGPVEHLLGWHGEKFIDRVEQRAGQDPRFARAMTGVWQYKMSDDVWTRVRAIQAKVSDPLP